MTDTPITSQVKVWSDLEGNHAEIWQITPSLRWNVSVLEQAWQCLTNGKIEWRPVPMHPEPLGVEGKRG